MASAASIAAAPGAVSRLFMILIPSRCPGRSRASP
jgi:hypothetical protein